MNYGNNNRGGDGEGGGGPIVQHFIRIWVLFLRGQRGWGVGGDRFIHENHSGCNVENRLDGSE